ncbi:hypothetical protein BKA93DRAFT_729237 [Sparassis latifolia]
MQPAQLWKLPSEILIAILKYLDFKELLKCNLICKTFRHIVAQSLELQYIIELAADGMVDGPPGRMTTADRLHLLLDRRRRWRTLDWTKKTLVSVPGPCQAYELVGGVFAKSMSVSNLVGSRHFIATWLPTRSEPAISIMRDDLGIATRDFAIDPSQDLIAFVDADDNSPNRGFLLKIQFRTISTNKAHPQARSTEVRAPIPFSLGSSFVQIVDDIVGMFFWVHGPGLIIWNWMTGEILVYCIGFDLPAGTWDFAFLSNRAFMLTATAGSGSVEIFSFSGHTRSRVPTHVAKLNLPRLKHGQEPHHFSSHSGPFVHGPIAGKPFETAREARVHLLSLHYGQRGPQIHLFVQNKFFLSLIPENIGSGENWACVERPWESWGPANTRFMEHNVQFQWLRYVHGQRVVLPPFLPNGQNPICQLCVIDFNVHKKRINDPVDANQPAENLGQYIVMCEATRVAAGDTFQADVVTYLPYSVTTRAGPYSYDGFMIDDERIIGVKVS